jgi:hypothetical protein
MFVSTRSQIDQRETNVRARTNKPTPTFLSTNACKQDQKDAIALATMNNQFETQRALSEITAAERRKQDGVIAGATKKVLQGSKPFQSTRSLASEIALKSLQR